MGFSQSWTWLLPVIALLLVFSATPAAAFGAGNIPGYAYLEGKAFRHGDIEDVLEELNRSGGGAAGVLGALTGGLLAKKFKGLDIKRIYFGNWLRDYSQAMDCAGLSKLSRQAILNLVMVLGFLAHGYATGEFEVTEARLGVYLPTEHIDNPKDYNDNKDARQIHPALRPPVDPAELEIDPRTGMLNYIANEGGHWDTSKALVRRVLMTCIEMGRRARSSGDSDAQYEAFRLLGSALHTMEDFTAHSNYCELALVKLGHNQVFCHVGSNVHVRSPDGHMVAPLVTGTFGGSDFIHSLLGEATDHISSASVSDLNKQIDAAKNAPQDRSIDGLRDLLFQLPNGEGNNLSRDMDNITNMRAQGQADPMDMSPQQLHAVLWQVLSFRDNVAKVIANTIERIPGLGSLIEKIGNSVATFVFVTIEPYVKPILQQATGALQQGSSEVVNSQDQFRVFNDPAFYHPTHSILAKDHFSMILNEPAGNIAKIIVRHVVNDVVKAWDDSSINAGQMVEVLLEVFHHPAFTRGTPLQREMMDHMQQWITGEDRGYVLNALTKEAVRNNKNHRKGHASDEHHPTQGPGGYTSFLPTPQHLQQQASGYMHQQAQHIPGYNQVHQGYNQFQHAFPASGRREFDERGYPVDDDPLRQPTNIGYNSEPPHPTSLGYPEAGQQSYQQPSYGQEAYAGNQFASPHGGYMPPPAASGQFGGPPGGYYSGPETDSGYPGAQYQQQQHHGQYGGQQGGSSGAQWSGQPPPPGRW